MIKQAEVLEHDADTASQRGQRVARRNGRVLAKQDEATPARLLSKVNELQERGLSCAGRSRKETEFAWPKGEADVAQHLPAVVVSKSDILKFDDQVISPVYQCGGAHRLIIRNSPDAGNGPEIAYVSRETSCDSVPIC